jgi:DMSO reductase family type II enzyme chaperone
VATTLPNTANPGELAEARWAVYRFLLAALDCPDVHNHGWLTSQSFACGLAGLCEQFGVAAPDGELFPRSPDDAQSDYLSCFEVGLKGPPVPLLASNYNHHEPVPATIHEHVLFYRHFGAAVSPGDPDPPDHLRHELGFLLRLDELRASEQVDSLSAAKARVDFLSRQLARWVGAAAQAAREAGIPPVYVALLELLGRVVDDDLAGSIEVVEALERNAP